jgi:hypothetical protein
MKERGYRWLSTKLVRDKASEPAPQDDTIIDCNRTLRLSGNRHPGR